MNIYVLLDEVHDSIQLSRTVAIRLIEQSAKLEEKIGSYLEEQEEYLQEDAEIIPLKTVDTEPTEWVAQGQRPATRGAVGVGIASVLIVAMLSPAGIEDCHLKTLKAVPRLKILKGKGIKSLLVEAQGT